MAPAKADCRRAMGRAQKNRDGKICLTDQDRSARLTGFRMGMIRMGERERGAERILDLDALNSAEREALALLAEGHTAKSIAELTGRSVAAINERLREARRKTGIGSSRELARLYAAAQKNRDEKIDLAASLGSEATADPQAGGTRRRRKGRIVMPLILIGGLAAALVTLQAERGGNPANRATQIPPDPLVVSVLPAAPDVSELHDFVRKEARDVSWADRTEAELRSGYSAIPHMTDDGPVRVICSTSLCEVAAVLPDDKRMTKAENLTFYRDLATNPFFDRMEKLGLKQQMSSMGGSNAKGSRKVFVAYWARWKNKAEPDTLLDGSLNVDERGQRRYYAQLRREARDARWADPVEAGLRSALQNLAVLKGADHRLTAHCGLSLCEVSATTTLKPSLAEHEAFLSELQSKQFTHAAERLGLASITYGFSKVPGTSRGMYVGYYSRVPS
jgi:DNA-binding CsgD family transcriptional regulator